MDEGRKYEEMKRMIDMIARKQEQSPQRKRNVQSIVDIHRIYKGQKISLYDAETLIRMKVIEKKNSIPKPVIQRVKTQSSAVQTDNTISVEEQDLNYLLSGAQVARILTNEYAVVNNGGPSVLDRMVEIKKTQEHKRQRAIASRAYARQYAESLRISQLHGGKPPSVLGNQFNCTGTLAAVPVIADGHVPFQQRRTTHLPASSSAAQTRQQSLRRPIPIEYQQLCPELGNADNKQAQQEAHDVKENMERQNSSFTNRTESKQPTPGRISQEHDDVDAPEGNKPASHCADGRNKQCPEPEWDEPSSGFDSEQSDAASKDLADCTGGDTKGSLYADVAANLTDIDANADEKDASGAEVSGNDEPEPLPPDNAVTNGVVGAYQMLAGQTEDGIVE